MSVIGPRPGLWNQDRGILMKKMLSMVMWIVENKWKQLSIMEYRQICKFAEITNNDELRMILQQLVG